MSAPKKLDTQTETQVVAMLARGDTQQAIVNWLDTEKSVTMTVQGIGAIKARNAEALDYMKTKLVQHTTTAATSILEKSRRLIDKRLDKALSLEEELLKLRKDADDGEIDDKEYYRRLDIIMRNQLSVTELNSLTKESFNQSQIEAGKPTSIADNPAQAKENLGILLAAIASKDDRAALKAIFPDA